MVAIMNLIRKRNTTAMKKNKQKKQTERKAKTRRLTEKRMKMKTGNNVKRHNEDLRPT